MGKVATAEDLEKKIKCTRGCPSCEGEVGELALTRLLLHRYFGGEELNTYFEEDSVSLRETVFIDDVRQRVNHLTRGKFYMLAGHCSNGSLPDFKFSEGEFVYWDRKIEYVPVDDISDHSSY